MKTHTHSLLDIHNRHRTCISHTALTSEGFTLFELMLFVALFSILCTGFIQCMFSFSAVVASHTSRHNEIVVLTLFKQLVTYHLYHEDQIYLKEGKKETELRMHESAGNVTINTSMLKRLLVSYPDVHLATATYQMYRYSDIHFFDSHRYVNATYVLNNHTYSMDVLIP